MRGRRKGTRERKREREKVTERGDKFEKEK